MEFFLYFRRKPAKLKKIKIPYISRMEISSPEIKKVPIFF